MDGDSNKIKITKLPTMYAKGYALFKTILGDEFIIMCKNKEGEKDATNEKRQDC